MAGLKKGLNNQRRQMKGVGVSGGGAGKVGNPAAHSGQLSHSAALQPKIADTHPSSSRRRRRRFKVELLVQEPGSKFNFLLEL